MSVIYLLRDTVLKLVVRKRTVWEHTVHGTEKTASAEAWHSL